MNHATSVQKKRETWGDVIRGICSLCVILAHIPGNSDVVIIYIAPFTLPCFFILTGYFTKNYGGVLSDFLYNKVLKELILKLMFCFSLTTFSLGIIAGLILHPSTIPEWLYDTAMSFLFKPVANFFSILVVCSLLFILINKLCRDKPVPMIAAGTALAAVGYAISRPRIIRLWNWDTALVCVLFYILGYCARQTGVLSRFHFRPKHALISGAVFVALATAFGLTLGVENVRIIVGNNTFQSPLVSVPLFLTGNLFMIALAKTFPVERRPFRLLMYIGRHSMLYFMIGGPVLAYVHYFHTLAFERLHWSFLQSVYYKVPVYLILTALLTLIPSAFSDRFLPALNGTFRLPKELPRRRPKTCVAVCAAVLLALAGFLAAAYSGAMIPNQVYARHYPVQGVDVSSYQGIIDWKQLEKQNVRFAYIKATEGSGHIDKRFADNWSSVSETGIAAGAYHFFSFESSGRAQAEHFISLVPVTENALPPVVDLEYYGSHERHPLPAEKVVPELKELLEALEQHYGRRPMLYVTEPCYLQYVYQRLEGYDIWFRSVITDPPEGSWKFWQYSDRGKLNGYDGEETFIDLNAFLGTEEDWQSFLNGGNSLNE